MKKCNSCNKLKNESEYYAYKRLDKYGNPYFHPSCKICVKNDRKEDYNKERKNKLRRNRYHNNESVRRKRLNENYKRLKCLVGDFTQEEWGTTLHLFNNKCAYCSKDLKNKSTVDHFLPVSKGGVNTIDNLVPACKSCNCKKHNKDPFQFIKLDAIKVNPYLLVFICKNFPVLFSLALHHFL